MQWDVFCRVIDNFGDIGVCWRLAVDLGQRGHTVRLWVDDASALRWMAPQVHAAPDKDLPGQTGQGQPGVTVCDWQLACQPLTDAPTWAAGDVVIEAFGCHPPDAFLERMQVRASQGQPAQWVNLEYLSAEDYVERSHGLRSPVWHGPGQGLHKRFFYPGFTAATGGLLREPGLLAQRQATCTSQAKAAFLAELGVMPAPGEPLVLVFCYPSAPLPALLDRLAAQAPAARVLLTPGPAQAMGLAWAQDHADAPLHLHALPPLPQEAFDRLLWCCDLNLVRGEDSAVRALWAGQAHLWQIYEQDDGVHAAKLQAFMDRWLAGWPPSLDVKIRAWWLAWNGLGPMPDTLPDWADGLRHWRALSAQSRAALLAQADLTSQLITFVTSSG